MQSESSFHIPINFLSFDEFEYVEIADNIGKLRLVSWKSLKVFRTLIEVRKISKLVNLPEQIQILRFSDFNL